MTVKKLLEMERLNYYKIILSCGFLLCLGHICAAQSENPHWFKTDNWNYDARCNPCHIARENQEGAAAGRFSSLLLSEDTLTNLQDHDVSEISQICYSCHDETVAIIQHSETFSEFDSNNSAMGHAHPVSKAYPTGDYKILKYRDPEKTPSGLGGTIQSDLLFDGKIECISCHNVHFSSEVTACSSCPPVDSETAKKRKSLLKSNDRSLLCFTCHKL